jgi:uncharacterized MAPEG superfamily protein
MTLDLTLLGWTLVLAFVQVLLPALARNRETGVAYNAGPRDAAGPPVGVVTGRLKRAQANLFETLPLVAVGLMIAHVIGREGVLTVWGSGVYLAARLVYLPMYVFGVPYMRSLVWAISVIGLALILFAILRPA